MRAWQQAAPSSVRSGTVRTRATWAMRVASRRTSSTIPRGLICSSRPSRSPATQATVYTKQPYTRSSTPAHLHIPTPLVRVPLSPSPVSPHGGLVPAGVAYCAALPSRLAGSVPPRLRLRSSRVVGRVSTAAFEIAIIAGDRAGCRRDSGKVKIGMDVAASEFWKDEEKVLGPHPERRPNPGHWGCRSGQVQRLGRRDRRRPGASVRGKTGLGPEILPAVAEGTFSRGARFWPSPAAPISGPAHPSTPDPMA